jgi:aspartyl-tRNA(Asn)/glutamyl-tRNA(Gln) amidotransferase subunit B
VSSEILDRFELVCGVEVHAQLNTRSKLFCGCAVEFGAEPNSRTCPVCLGLPGVLPVVNAQAFEKVLRIALAFGSKIAERTEFDRKNYYYPDLPKNYQISQNYANLGVGGSLLLMKTGKEIHFHNVHLEEDAGKNLHPEGGIRDATYVDLNRAGTPLAEIVTMPDFRSVEEIDDYMHTLTQLLVDLNASNAQMQEGNLRFEASVSVRPKGETKLYKRVEIKNLNSYAAVRGAVRYEHARQCALVAAGHSVAQETRLWDETGDESRYAEPVPESSVRALLPADWKGRTALMRSKESAPDYRYFPEPDLPPIPVSPALLEKLGKELPEFPGVKARRLVALGVSEKTATETFQSKPWLLAYFERLLELGVPAVDAAHYCDNQIAQVVNERGGYDAWTKNPVPPEHVAELHDVISRGETTKDIALKQVWPKVHVEGLAPRAAIQKYGLVALSEDEVRKACVDAWQAAPRIVADLLARKMKAKQGLKGPVMRATKGKAPPELVDRIFDELLAAEQKKKG